MKYKKLLLSLHWSMQQTAILLLSVLGLAGGLSQLAALMHADENVDPDWVTRTFMKMVLGNAIGIILLVVYSRRKRDYLALHQGDNDDSEG